MVPFALAASLVAPVLLGSLVGYGKPPKERQVSCIVMLRMGPQQLGLHALPIPALVKSTAVAGAAAKQALGIEPDSYHTRIDVEVGQNMTQDAMILTLSAGIDPTPAEGADAAERYLDALLRRLREAVSALHANYRALLAEELSDHEDGVNRARAELDQVQKRLSELRSTPGLEGLSHHELRNLGMFLRNEVANQQRTIADYRMRLEMGEMEPERVSSHELATLWREVVELKEARLQEMLKLAEQGAIDPAELKEYEARLEESRAKALQYSRRPRGIGPAQRIRPHGGAQSRAPAIEELEAQLQRTQERLEKLDEARAMHLATELERLEEDERRLVARIRDIEGKRDEADQRLRLAEPFSMEVVAGGGSSARQQGRSQPNVPAVTRP